MEALRAEPKIILLVEDNPDDVELILRAFDKNQITDKVVTAADGIQALDYLFGSAPAPHLVLLDLQLPRMGGFEVLRRLRANDATKLQPVVIFTSSAEQEDVLDGYRSGANSYVRKPIDFGQLVEAARQLALFWLRLNQCPPVMSLLPA